ncbi:MAG: regulatory protein RecX [Deltaproteobacteria bacterium]|nr:regulatory protein RecX [Deltaproteobacteria bacterium]
MKERNMVNQVREGNSSSQNVKLFITGITRRGSSISGYSVWISDGSSFFVSTEFLEENSIELNKSVDLEFLEKMEIEADSIKAYEKALDLISMSEQSSGGLYLKLRRKGFKDLSCKIAVSKLKAKQLLNDERFAEMWIFSRLQRHPEGKLKILAGLSARGVPSDIARIAIEKNISEADLEKAVMVAGNKILVKFSNSLQKTRIALFRRGFTNREIDYFLDNINV